MLHYVRETLTKGEKRIEKNPQDSHAYFAMALAKIAKIQWAIHQKRYFIIAQETSNIWDYLEKAKGGTSQNYDIYFLMGLLHYQLDSSLRPYPLLFFDIYYFRNRQKGLQGTGFGGAKRRPAQGTCASRTFLGLFEF